MRARRVDQDCGCERPGKAYSVVVEAAKKEILVKMEIQDRIRSLNNLMREALRGTPLFRPARSAYFWLFNREPLRERHALERFYRQFVFPGDLAFDIGANVGDRSEVMLNIGARVVAVEPNPACVVRLRELRFRNLAIEPVAVGDVPGTRTLHLSHSSGHSTLSEQWMAVSREKYGREWLNKISVPVTTLAALVQKYGQPRFIKIDVEGSEFEVLKGLGVLPSFLSFEFLTALPEATIKCLSLPCFTPLTRYNLVLGEGTSLHFAEWLDQTALIQTLEEQRASGVSWGDVLVASHPDSL